MCPAQKIISSVLCALLLAGCLSCAAQPFLGLYNSTKGFGVNAIRSVPGQNEFDNYTLYADIYGLPLGQSAAPGGFFSYTRDYIFRTIEIDEIVFDFYAGAGVSAGYVRDREAEKMGGVFALCGDVGVRVDFSRLISIALSFRTDLGLYISKEPASTAILFSLYKNGLIRTLHPQISILFRL